VVDIGKAAFVESCRVKATTVRTEPKDATHVL
jgi:hypothetical protein